MRIGSAASAPVEGLSPAQHTSSANVMHFIDRNFMRVFPSATWDRLWVTRTRRHGHDRAKPARLQGIRQARNLAGCSSHHSRSQVEHLFETARLFDFTITRQIACPHQCMINPRNTGGPILAPITYDFMFRPVVHANVRRSESCDTVAADRRSKIRLIFIKLCSRMRRAWSATRPPVCERRNMKTITIMAVAAAIAFSAVSFAATPDAAKKGQTSPGHYCLSYEAGSDCSFTSLEQCQATASGIGGNCVHQDAGGRAGDHAAHR
jgi:hypothetical protein